jgi:hypothetical protein
MTDTASQSETRNFLLSNDTVLKLNLPHFIDRDCFFVLGLRKSGSTLLHNIVHFICNSTGIPVLDIPHQAFEQNVSVQEWSDCEDLQAVIKDGAAYTGFRSLPSFLTDVDLFQSRNKVLLVRDPRDAIVSGYFSVAYSHQVPKSNPTAATGERENLLKSRNEALQQSIDEFVTLRAPALNRTILEYVSILDFPNLKVYRYEDVIMKKRDWIKDMAQFLGLELSESTLETILDLFDVIPDSEKATEHIRQVTPGDHKNKLQPNTIRHLDDLFSDVMKAFSY